MIYNNASTFQIHDGTLWELKTLITAFEKKIYIYIKITTTLFCPRNGATVDGLNLMDGKEKTQLFIRQEHPTFFIVVPAITSISSL